MSLTNVVHLCVSFFLLFGRFSKTGLRVFRAIFLSFTEILSRGHWRVELFVSGLGLSLPVVSFSIFNSKILLKFLGVLFRRQFLNVDL